MMRARNSGGFRELSCLSFFLFIVGTSTYHYSLTGVLLPGSHCGFLFEDEAIIYSIQNCVFEKVRACCT